MTTHAHLPMASWMCTNCGQPWPCLGAQEAMLADYGRHGWAGNHAALAVAMAKQLARATRDLPDDGPDALTNRFMGWIPTTRATQ